MSLRGPKPTIVERDEIAGHHDCAVAGCAAWGVTRFRGVLEVTADATEIEGWLCESHRGEPIKGVSIGYRLDGTPMQAEPMLVPQERKEVFRPVNRAARRAAKRGKR